MLEIGGGDEMALVDTGAERWGWLLKTARHPPCLHSSPGAGATFFAFNYPQIKWDQQEVLMAVPAIIANQFASLCIDLNSDFLWISRGVGNIMEFSERAWLILCKLKVMGHKNSKSWTWTSFKRKGPWEPVLVEARQYAQVGDNENCRNSLCYKKEIDSAALGASYWVWLLRDSKDP